MVAGSVIRGGATRSEIIHPGAWRKKIKRQKKFPGIQPASHGPMVGATTTAIPYTAKAMPRFSSENVSFKIACSLGCKPPPPTPCKIRKNTSTPRLGAKPHKNELTVNKATQDM